MGAGAGVERQLGALIEVVARGLRGIVPKQAHARLCHGPSALGHPRRPTFKQSVGTSTELPDDVPQVSLLMLLKANRRRDRRAYNRTQLFSRNWNASTLWAPCMT